MSDELPAGPLSVLKHELESLRKEWWCFALLGAALIVLGSLAFGMSFVTTLVTVTFFGFLLLIGGITQVVGAFWAGRWSGFLIHLLVGILYVVTAVMMIHAPAESAIALTLLLAVALIVGGMFRIVAALVLRFHGWGWPLLNGVVSLLLGMMIYRQWPGSGLRIIGLFVGIEMIFNGWTWVMLGLGLRSLPKA